jgi:hypothetical protein
MVVQSLYLADLQKVSGHLERKICAVGVTRCLTESPKMLSDYKDLWYVRNLSTPSPFAGHDRAAVAGHYNWICFIEKNTPPPPCFARHILSTSRACSFVPQ